MYEESIIYIIRRSKMSDTGAGGLGEEKGEGATDTLEYAAPISAVAPKVVHQEESQVEVSASPAFQCLDEVNTNVHSR